MNSSSHNQAAKKASPLLLAATLCLCSVLPLGAADTNFVSFHAGSLPDTGPSLLRVLGALALVLGLFLGGAWVVRNGRWNAFSRGKTTRLNVLESRSLGARQALYVVGYGQERFLVGSTPAGINLVSHLAPAQEGEPQAPAAPNGVSFAQALGTVLRGQKVLPDSRGGSK
ncbi:MAG TPA: flagellar biosynthetic protein FliO [Verrucomicrobiae bacterium]|jgi:flagellar biosynthetic protein FliO|nr:flagellar biosynthetic protein FliO [Verrucomicrobiae bacterium]